MNVTEFLKVNLGLPEYINHTVPLLLIVKKKSDSQEDFLIDLYV